MHLLQWHRSYAAARALPCYVVCYQVPRSSSSPGLSAATSPTATCPKSVRLWLTQFITGPVPIFIRCNSSRVKCLEAALHSRLPASWNDPGFTCGFPADFLLSLSGPGGLRGHEKPTFCALISLLPAGAAPAKLNYGAPSQATPNIRNLPTCPSLFSSRLCCFFQSISAGL